MALAYDVPLLPRREPPPSEQRWRRPIVPGGIDSDEPQMETFAHFETVTLLFVSLLWLWRDRHDFFAAGNLTIYFSPTQLKSEDFRGPDFFVVLGTQREPPRKSWVVWDEGGKYPNVIVEALSSSTAAVDRGLKKDIYQDVFHTPEYFLFDPETNELTGYRLDAGKYRLLAPDAAGRLRSDELELLLGVHEGHLRLFLPNGELVPVTDELGLKAEAEARHAKMEAQRADAEAQHAKMEAQHARMEAQRADSAELRADSAELRARAYADRLRALGIDPDTVE